MHVLCQYLSHSGRILQSVSFIADPITAGGNVAVDAGFLCDEAAVLRRRIKKHS